MKFNINDKVRVRLTDRGRRILREQHIELSMQIPAMRSPWKQYVPPKEDADGWSEWTLWDLMNRFGPYLHPGAVEPPFYLDIEIPETGDREMGFPEKAWRWPPQNSTG